jgi:hypothetical protein
VPARLIALPAILRAIHGSVRLMGGALRLQTCERRGEAGVVGMHTEKDTVVADRVVEASESCACGEVGPRPNGHTIVRLRPVAPWSRILRPTRTIVAAGLRRLPGIIAGLHVGRSRVG